MGEVAGEGGSEIMTRRIETGLLRICFGELHRPGNWQMWLESPEYDPDKAPYVTYTDGLRVAWAGEKDMERWHGPTRNVKERADESERERSRRMGPDYHQPSQPDQSRDL